MFPRNGTPGGPGGRRFRLRAMGERNSWYNAYRMEAKRDAEIVNSMFTMSERRFRLWRRGSEIRGSVLIAE